MSVAKRGPSAGPLPWVAVEGWRGLQEGRERSLRRVPELQDVHFC